MIQQLPYYISITFGATTLLSFILFHTTIKQSAFAYLSNKISLGIIGWIFFHGILGYSLFYVDTIGDTPPKLPFIGVFPLFILFIVLFNTSNGKKFIDSLPLKKLTLISIVRIPVEIVLWWLAIHDTIPELMTFEGRNLDILAGITAPLVIYFGFNQNSINRKVLLTWNIISLLLLLNIIINALFSFPTIIQLQAFDQPNIGLLYFPFVWLPTFVAPLVLFTHFISIRQLTMTK